MESEPVDARQLQINAVRNNIKVIGKSDNWQTLAFLETLAIKDRKPSLNSGLKAAKELSLFWRQTNEDVILQSDVKPISSLYSTS